MIPTNPFVQSGPFGTRENIEGGSPTSLPSQFGPEFLISILISFLCCCFCYDFSSEKTENLFYCFHQLKVKLSEDEHEEKSFWKNSKQQTINKLDTHIKNNSNSNNKQKQSVHQTMDRSNRRIRLVTTLATCPRSWPTDGSLLTDCTPLVCSIRSRRRGGLLPDCATMTTITTTSSSSRN